MDVADRIRMDPKICKRSKNDRMNEICDDRKNNANKIFDDRKNSGIERWLKF